MLAIRPMTPEDAETVLRIYKQGIDSGHATFQAQAPSWETWDRGHLPTCRLTAWLGEDCVGWAALSPISARAVYRGVCELSLYVDRDCRGQGVGRVLLSALIEASEKENIWTLQAGIFPENAASIKLHQDHGFKLVGLREAIGRMGHGPMAGQWRDVMLLERRSRVAGV